jgi:hypothetical protein
MTTHRYPGGIIAAAAPTVTSAGASGVWTVEEAVRYKAAGLWPDGTGTDPYFPYTTLLLHGDGTNGAQNNTFLDSSTNNFTITRNGNTTQGSFSPYVGPGNWSNYFDGTGDYLSVPNNANLYFGTGDFTVECWFYLNGNAALNGSSTRAAQLFSCVGGGGTPTAGWGLAIVGNSTTTGTGFDFQNRINSTTVYTITATVAINQNAWNHVAVVRSGTTITIYLNGTSVGSGTLTNQSITSSDPLWIGRQNVTNYTGDFPGYISNVRIVKGTALYTTAFTPSTSPIIATSQTTLLTCNNNGFNDLSAANNVITKNGDTQVSKFSPFTLYQTTPTSYSGYFDGTGDYLSVPATAVQLGAQEFTFETWAYFSDVSTDRTLIYWNGNGSGDAALHVRIISGKWALWISKTGGGSWAIQQSALGTTVVANQWYHVAIVRAGNNVRMFVNGTDITSGGYALSGSLLTTYTVNQIGVYNSAYYYMQGSLSNFRIVTGAAVYTANFTPSTTPLTATTTVTSAQSNSVSFDGTGDYLSFPSNSALAMSTGDFTIEGWANFGALTNKGIFQLATTAFPAAVSGLAVSYDSANNAWGIYYGGSATRVDRGPSIVTGTWYHFALVRASGALTLYINGTAYLVTASDTTNYTGTALIVGGFYSTSFLMNGFISNFRITKGQALYTAAFTPSTTPLTTTSQGATASNVSLLTCQDRMFEDNSLNYFAVTSNGDAKTTSMNPFVSTNGIGGTSYSGYFNGSSYLSASSNAAFGFGTGDFTVEYWINGTSWASTPNITDFRAGAGASGYSDYVTSAGFPAAWWHDAGRVQSSIAISTNTWNHVAFTRQSGTVRVFVNGVLGGTATAAQDLQASVPCRIGVTISSTNYFTGYLSNFRAIKGIALYTASFSPPASPLTAISGTSFLTCQSTTFIDNSLNAIAITNTGTTLNDTLNPFSGATSLLTAQSTTFIDNSAIPKTLTANGNATPKRASPFTDSVTGPTVYTTTTYGGSGYFDGTGDYLTLSSTTALPIGTESFTVEMWVYKTNAWNTGNQVLLCSGVTGSFQFWVDSAVPAIKVSYLSSTNILSFSTATLSINSWYHLAVTRSGNTFTLYVNGTSVATATDAGSFVAPATVYIANYFTGAAYWTGYISNLRVVRGIVIYTGPFVPPAAPVTAVTGTQLLVNGTNGGIFDNTTVNDLETVNSAQISTSVVKYGTGSMSFNGTNSYLYGAHNTALNLGTGDMTVECWLYLNSTTGTQTIASKWQVTNESWIWQVSSTAITFVYATVAASTFTWSPVINTWYHMAVTKSGNSLRCFVNGTQVGSTITNTGGGASSTSAFAIGANNDGPQQYLNGYIDDLRVTKGIARYTTNFTPPAGPFPNI